MAKNNGKTIVGQPKPDDERIVKEPSIVDGKQQASSLVNAKQQTDGSALENDLKTNQQPTKTSSTLTAERSTDAISSELSIGFELPSPVEASNIYDNVNQLQIIEGPELYTTILRTVCGYGIHCGRHNRMAVQKLQNHCDHYWLPYAYASENDRYLNTLSNIIELMKLSNDPKALKSADLIKNIQLYNIHRIQIPDGQFVSRYIFIGQLTNDDSAKISCCTDNDRVKWLPLAEIIENCGQIRFWGIEVVKIAVLLKELQSPGAKVASKYPNISEFTSQEMLKYVHNTAASTNKTAVANQTIALLNAAKFSEKDVVKIYGDFVQHCYPSSTMTYWSFIDYMTRMDLLVHQPDGGSTNSTNDIDYNQQLYRSIAPSWRQRSFVYFNEFLVGLAALSTAANLPLRYGYVFRYYDHDSDGYLDEHDFRRIIRDIREASMLSTEPKAIENECKRLWSQLNLESNNRISLQSFLGQSGRINGLEQLFIANRPVVETIHAKHLYEFIVNQSGRPFGPKLTGTCPKCTPNKTFSLAYNAVKLGQQGRVEESRPLIQMNCGELNADEHFRSKTNAVQVKHSIELVFNEHSIPNQVLAIVRKMYDFNRLPLERKHEAIRYVQQHLTADLIIELCRQMTEILLVEPPVIKVNTPCLIFGDLHGNINDLLTYERQLWPLAPYAMAPNVLFLGDYVDRGDYSVEVVCYLFAMKLLSPTKFFLLRGNHEIRSIQRNFTFAHECIVKYQYQNGSKILEEFNQTFDHLPLVGIVDESIFCAHGGIPFSTSKIEDLYRIPQPLPEPETQSKIAWEILWSDPVNDDEFVQVCQFRNHSQATGFVDNLRRSTGYYFAERATKNFLKTNNLSHVIRAHELEMDGYRFRHSGLLITIFSSSKYCNTNNRSAAIFVNNHSNSEGFIKVIALET